MIVVLLAAIAAMLFAIPPDVLRRTVLPEVVAAVLLILGVVRYSQRIADVRLTLARRAAEGARHAEVLELAEPFLRRGPLWPMARFDPEGEAMYLALVALDAEGRAAEARAVRAYLLAHRRGTFAEKARDYPLK